MSSKHASKGVTSRASATTQNDEQDSALNEQNLTLVETADWLRCSTRTLQRMIETGQGPPVVRLSERRLIFRLSDVRRWLEDRIKRPDISSARGRPPKRQHDEDARR